MTALGRHEHFQCDQCRTVARVRHHDVVYRDTTSEMRPDRWLRLEIDGGARLEQLRHLCPDCRNSLDRHFFGPNGCDGPKIQQLEALLRSVATAWNASRNDLDGWLKVIADVNSYFEGTKT